MVSSSLKVKVHRAEGLVKNGENLLSGFDYSVRIAIANHKGKSTSLKGKGFEDIDEELIFDLENTSDSDKVSIEIVADDRTLTSTTETLASFLSGFNMKEFSFGKKVAGGKLILSAELIFPTNKKAPSSNKNNTKIEKQSSTVSNNGTKSEPEHSDVTQKEAIHRPLALAPETYRPWYFRASYYYNTTKSVYLYTSSIRGVSSVCRVGESSFNYILNKLNIKSVHNVSDLDKALVPAFDNLDSVVDEKIALGLKALLDAQNYVVDKKNGTVNKVSEVASSTVNKVSSVTSAAVHKVTDVTSYTKEKVTNVAGQTRDSVASAAYASIDTVAIAKKIAVANLRYASNTTYNVVSSNAKNIISYVPILGPKITAN